MVRLEQQFSSVANFDYAILHEVLPISEFKIQAQATTKKQEQRPFVICRGLPPHTSERSVAGAPSTPPYNVASSPVALMRRAYVLKYLLQVVISASTPILSDLVLESVSSLATPMMEYMDETSDIRLETTTLVHVTLYPLYLFC